jgi:hypothetical protein
MISDNGFFGHLVEGTVSSAIVLAVPMLVLLLANHAFHALAPGDFNQVSIVRRAGVVGGTLLGGGILLAALLAGKSQGSGLLPGGNDSATVFFLRLLGSQLAWFLPARLAQAPTPALWLILAGVTVWILPAASAAVYWRGPQRIGAVTIAVLIVPFMALSLVYAFTVIIWIVHLLNVWSIAVAGLIYQHYRNSQLGHG